MDVCKAELKGDGGDGGIGVTEKFEFEAHRAIRDLIQRGIDEELNATIKAGKYERTGEREGFRKGRFTTTFGISELNSQKGCSLPPCGKRAKNLLQIPVCAGMTF
ncbi:MAG: hypothetical protein ABH844_06845 [Candidatus Omnitrophota bacterium]